MATVDFDAFDADNHYYEATDAFTRHLPANRSRLVTWATINGKPRMVVDNKVFRFIPNPTFDPVARPGVLDEYFRGKRAGDSIALLLQAIGVSPRLSPSGERHLLHAWTRKRAAATLPAHAAPYAASPGRSQRKRAMGVGDRGKPD